MPFEKIAFTIKEHIELLKSRGLEIEDEKQASHLLNQVSYYRLAGYWWPMQEDKVNHSFKQDSIFPDVINLYNFDRELRILLFNVIERIEISLRTKLIYHLSHMSLIPGGFRTQIIF